jgi:hypothetical protein
VLEVGRDENGQRIRRWHSGFKTKKAAELERTRLLGQLDAGSYTEPNKLTVRQFIEGQWLPAIAATIRPTTLAMYRVNVEAHILPTLGPV